jgi:hypothetical protein
MCDQQSFRQVQPTIYRIPLDNKNQERRIIDLEHKTEILEKLFEKLLEIKIGEFL